LPKRTKICSQVSFQENAISGTELHRTFGVPMLKFLTTLSLSTYFIINSASKYKRLEEQFSDYWMRSHEKFKDLKVELSPFVESEIKN
jgi:hypothetical protein